ncbi:hypothetical protein QJQ45_008025 [Haematococcus lacustris]|nr:hypothetical protein QJQ45_008025 [Haematococcus lacustris]
MRVRVLADGQEAFEYILAEAAVIPNLADRNMFLQVCRGLPSVSEKSRPSAALEDVLAAYPDLHARLDAVPRCQHDTNTVHDVGKKLERSLPTALPRCTPAGLSKRWYRIWYRYRGLLAVGVHARDRWPWSVVIT